MCRGVLAVCFKIHTIHISTLCGQNVVVVLCCSCLVCIVVILCVFVVLCVHCCFFTLDARLLARSQYSEGPATGHLDTGFSWFPCA